MTSVATNAFAWALDYMSEWAPDDEEQRVAYDLWPGPVPVADGAGTGGGAIAAAVAAQQAGETTSRQLVEQALAAVAADNERLVGFVELTGDVALAEADACDADLAAGTVRGPLHGVPISVKDVIHVHDVPTRSGSAAYERVPEHDAWSVARLREAGAVIMGKVSTHEFALGVTSPQSRNPVDDTRIPGGSSGGSAVSVATGMSMGSLCTDTRASSRVPAALSGVVGFKPTYGSIPTRGVVPLSWTMDHVGMIAGSVGDAALMMDVLQGRGGVAAAVGTGVEGLALGLPEAAFEDVDDQVLQAVNRSIDALRVAGASTAPLTTPAESDFTGANAGGLITSRCEAATFHRGIGTDRALYWDEVRDQLDAADDVIALDYIQAQRYRDWLRQRMLTVFDDFDALVMPTVPTLAPPVEDAEDYLTILSRNAILWSFVGFPAISVPAAYADGALPVGLQIVGPPYSEPTLAAIAGTAESNRP